MEPRDQHQPASKSNSQISNIIRCLMKGEIEPTIDEKLQHIWTSLKITMGNLLIRGFRTFKYMIDQQCIIFMKKQQFNTVYLFFKIALKTQQMVPPIFYQSIGHCVDQINKFKKKEMQKYIVLILYALDYSILQIASFKQISQVYSLSTPTKKSQVLKLLPQNQYNQQCYAPTYQSKEQILINENEEQHKKLKQILYSYVDTFGQKHKTNFYKELTKKSLYLINTLNLIVFQQTKPISKSGESTPLYNQIESACWTLFKTGRLISDRKDIVFSGNGRILFVDLIFNYNFNAYLSQEYQQEVTDLFNECKKAYVEAKIKVIKIENSLTPRHVYSYYSQIIKEFSKVPIYS